LSLAKPNNSSEIVGFRCAQPNLLVAETMIKAHPSRSAHLERIFYSSHCFNHSAERNRSYGMIFHSTVEESAKNFVDRIIPIFYSDHARENLLGIWMLARQGYQKGNRCESGTDPPL
jgi:hypothetical protein